MTQLNLYLHLFIEGGSISFPKTSLPDLKNTTALPDLLKQNKSDAFQFFPANVLGTNIVKEYPVYYMTDFVLKHPDNSEPCVKYKGQLRKLKPNDFAFDAGSGCCLYGEDRLARVATFFNPAVLQGIQLTRA